MDPSAAPLNESQAADAFAGLIGKGLLDTPEQFAARKQTPPVTRSEAAPAAQTPTPTQTAEPADQGAPSAQAQPGEGEPEAVTYANLEDFLGKNQLERDAFMALPVKVKVDGQESDIALAEVLKGFQLEKHVTQKSQQLAERERAWEAERAAAQQQLATHIQGAQALAQAALQQLHAEHQGVDWNALRASDPGRFAAEQLAFGQRQQQIQQYLANLDTQRAQQHTQLLATERDRLLSAIPEWRDAAKFQEAAKTLSSYAATRGFTPAELSGVFDHRQMLVLHDAAKVPALQAEVAALKAKLEGKTDAALKLVRAAPQMAAPGARVERNPNVVAFKESKAAVAKHPRDQSAQAAAFGQWAQLAKI